MPEGERMPEEEAARRLLPDAGTGTGPGGTLDAGAPARTTGDPSSRPDDLRDLDASPRATGNPCTSHDDTPAQLAGRCEGRPHGPQDDDTRPQATIGSSTPQDNAPAQPAAHHRNQPHNPQDNATPPQTTDSPDHTPAQLAGRCESRPHDAGDAGDDNVPPRTTDSPSTPARPTARRVRRPHGPQGRGVRWRPAGDRGDRPPVSGGGGLGRRGLRFLRRHRRVVVRLVLWSVLETAQTFLMGYALARALDEGFLRGRTGVGLGWLGAAVLAVAVGAYGTRRVYGAVAALVEPLRDRLVERVVARGVREADGGALSALTQQVEIARDTFAGVVMVSRSFVFTAGGALIGLASLAPPLLLVVAPPLVVGVGLFAASMRPLAHRQEAFLVADERLADRFGDVCAGLRDVTAGGAEERVAADVGERVEAELRAARSLARWGVPRVASIAVGGQLPVVLLLLTAPWLLRQGVTPGALVGALAYVTQSLLPALQNLVHGMGTSGSRLAVVLRRLVPAGAAADDVSGPDPRPVHPPVNSSARTPARAPALEVSGLTFAYGPTCAPVVDKLTLRVPPGTRLAVVGPSGIGKSTLVSLAAGLLGPQHGAIRLCGHPVPGSAAHAHRVVIPQEAYVFGGTFAENLGCLRPDPVPESELLAAAEAVGLAPLLDRHGGPGARVDPGALSAGERQLIALTRAYLSYACVALLDEATCHLDPGAEERAERAFASRTGTTLVVVAHRIASARRADRVLVMDGHRCAYGTHDDLLERSALYRDLVGSWSAAPPVPSQPALALRDPDGVDAVAGPGLARDGRHVVAHGPVGEVQAAGDLRDGRPVRGE